MPGLAGIEAIRAHHGPRLREKRLMLGELRGNRFHQAALESAQIVGIDLIVNCVQNGAGEVIGVVAGDLQAAWLEGVELCRRVCQVEIPEQVDIVIVGASGHPRDNTLYQAQKAMASAEALVKQGGVIILVAECRGGIGGQGFRDSVERFTSPDDAMRDFESRGFTCIGSQKGWLYCRSIRRAQLIVVTEHVSKRDLQRMLAGQSGSVEKALEMAVAERGSDCSIAVVPNGIDLIPIVGKGRERKEGD